MNAPVRPAEPAHVLDLSIERGPDGRSRLADRHVTFPWSVGRGYPGPAGDPLVVIPQCAGAGLLSGDHMKQRIRVGHDAALDLHSAGAMSTYGQSGGPVSRSDWTLELERGSRTRMFSEPYVLLDSADLVLHQTIFAEQSAELITIEGIVCSGDVSTVCWQMQTTLCRPDGSILFRDRQRAVPGHLKRVMGLPGRWMAFGSMIVLTSEPRKSLRTALRAAQDLEEVAYIAVATIVGDIGICARVATVDGQSLRDSLLHLMASETASKRCAC